MALLNRLVLTTMKNLTNRPNKLAMNFRKVYILKNTDFFNSGLLFLNRQEKYSRNDVFELPPSIRNFPYKVSLRTNINLSRGLFENQFKEIIETQEKDFWIKNL